MIQMIGNPDTPVYEWMSSLYGSPIAPAKPVLMRLVHELTWEQGVMQQWHLTTDDEMQWRVYLLEPDAKLKQGDLAHRSLPTDRILLSSDGCWSHCVSPEAMRTCMEQVVTLAWFDRLELVDDPPSVRQARRFLYALSRLQKWLLDGLGLGLATTAGAASLAITAEGAESLAALVSSFPHWLSDAAQQPSTQVRLAQLDCTALWQAIAPRPLLMLQARGDAWANPLGTRHTYSALKKYWPDEPQGTLEMIERDGAHAMQTGDWVHAARWWRHAHIR